MSDFTDSHAPRPAIQTVTLSFFRYDSAFARAWAFAMMGAARLALLRVPELEFWKLCGSGTGEGFTPRPNLSVYAVLCVWPSQKAANDGLKAQVFTRFRTRASENWTVFLSPVSCWGAWSGNAPFTATPQHSAPGPIAALTRASVKPSRALKFWNRVPDISRVIGSDPNVLFKIGIGEVPLLHQITFSIWPDTASMAAFARESGPHAEAIRSVREGNWFTEELYARFRITQSQGTWGGTSPLQQMDLAS